jgi:membrane-bound metal-dependent hydrolase YbcI (DUF457 family)
VFIGHFAVGFAAKKIAPQASLPALLFAPLFADALWPVLVAVGAEHVRIDPGNTVVTPFDFVSYPWSHSLLMLSIWGILLGALFRKRPDGARTWWVIAALVVSHWFLDWITHAPDMPLYPGGPKYGLGLWNSVMGTMIVELAMFIVGVTLYQTSTRPRDAVGRWAFYALVGLLLVAFIADSLDPSAPPSVRAVWISGLIATPVTLLWAWWIDRHREPVGTEGLRLER